MHRFHVLAEKQDLRSRCDQGGSSGAFQAEAGLQILRRMKTPWPPKEAESAVEAADWRKSHRTGEEQKFHSPRHRPPPSCYERQEEER